MEFSYYCHLCFALFRGLSAPEAEMLYMQEVEKMEGYGQESYQAKVGLQHQSYWSEPIGFNTFDW